MKPTLLSAIATAALLTTAAAASAAPPANTVRVVTRNGSDDVIGQPLYIGGTLAVDDAAFGNLGETNFSAAR